MRITDLRAVQPPTPGSPGDWRTQFGQIVVEVTTDEGIAGLGGGGGGEAAIHVIHTVLRDLIVGRDAELVEELYQEMLRHTSFYGRKGVVIIAISGVELALWDLRGKVHRTSVARLLDSETDAAKPIPTYTTVFDDRDTELALARGHAAVKLHVERFGDRPDPLAIGDLVGRVRQSLGPEAVLMIDAFARWDVDSSLRIAEAVAPHVVTWLEEPLRPNDLNGYEVLAKHSPVAIAGGEHEYTAEGFKELIDRGLHAVLQPDINWCGGMTTLVTIYQMASDAGVRVCPHRGCEPFALPAIAALDPQPLAESPRHWFNCLHGAPTIKNGFIHVSDIPGFGVTVDETIWE